MTYSKTTLRIALAGAACAFAMAVPAAQAAPPSANVQVCNQATPVSLGGDLTATDGDPTPPARYTQGLRAHPGQGVGLANAAAHSPALSACGDDDGGSGGGPIYAT